MLQLLLRRKPGTEDAAWPSQLKSAAAKAVEQADSQAAAGSDDREALVAAADAVAVVHRFTQQVSSQEFLHFVSGRKKNQMFPCVFVASRAMIVAMG